MGEKLPALWATLFLPNNIPHTEIVHKYVFGFNNTHMALVTDYGSLFNHHDSANVKHVSIGGTEAAYFEVSMGFKCANHNVLKTCMQNTTEVRTHKHFQGHQKHPCWTRDFR